MIRRKRLFGKTRGLTLLELIVAITASALLMAGAYRIFLYFQRQSIDQQRIARAQAQIFPAQASLEKNIRRAGAGIPGKTLTRNASSGATDTVLALAIGFGLSGKDTLTVRGNFTGVSSQLISPTSGTSATENLSLLSGTAGDFSAGDFVILEKDDGHETVRVTSRNTGASTLRTATRLFTYPAGTKVTKVVSVQYRVGIDSSLWMAQASGLSAILQNVVSLKFGLISFSGIVDSTPPYPLDSAQYVQYRLVVRVPKVGGNHLDRNVWGRILLRDL